jgi:hypothetical protein
MGIGVDLLDAIIREHAYKRIAGDLLLIGRHPVDIRPSKLLEMFQDHGIATPEIEAFAGDPATPWRRVRVDARRLFALFGCNSVRVLDATDEKGIDVAHRLGDPLPDRLRGCSDFIVDNGSIVDSFDPAATIETFAKMLRPGGRLLAINTLSNHFDPYAIPSATWYLDYFVTNGFADCRVYVLVYPPHEPSNAFCIDIDSLTDPDGEVRNFASAHHMAVAIFAEKDAASTTDLRPTPMRTRSREEKARHREQLARMRKSPRPHLFRSRGPMSFFDVRAGHLFMLTDYTAVDPSSEERRARPGGDRAGTTAAPAAVPAAHSRLRVLCVGTGRDGTQSLNHMIHRVFDVTGGLTVHEYCCRELNQAYCDFRESAEADASAIERMVADCPFDCTVGNGYAAILPFFARHYGRGLKLVHLRRADRTACIASLEKHAELFPTAYRHYSADPAAVVARMAAFHFGEMTQAQWEKLTIREKFGWYYDKTHDLVRQHAALFDQHVEISTESLDNVDTRRVIADFVAGPDAPLPPRTHLNASTIRIEGFPAEHRHKMHWLLGRLNLDEVAGDDLYALDYFLEKFVAWTGYQITNAPQIAPSRPASPHEISANLQRAVEIVTARLREIETLKDTLAAGSDKSTM